MPSLVQAALHLLSQDLKRYKLYQDCLISAVILTQYHSKLIHNSL